MKNLMMMLVAMTATSAAMAGFTTVNQTWASNGSGNELNLINGNATSGTGGGDSIIERLINNNAAQYTQYGVSGFSVARVEDFGAGITDQFWFNQNGHSTSTAVYSGSGQDLGYRKTGDLGTRITLYSASSQYGFLAPTVANFQTGPFNFVFSSQPSLFTESRSNQAFNNNGVDQMVAYKLTGPNNVVKYLIGIEDNNGSNGSYGNGDYDYNDFVLILDAVAPIPVPAAALLGLLGAGLVAGLKRRLA